MPSHSLQRWIRERTEALDEIENAHAMVGGTERGRRYATQQINYAYAALLSSHFQGFCRDLHSECVDLIVAQVPGGIHNLVGRQFVLNRALERGNPHPGAIGTDFSRLGMSFWTSVDALDNRNPRRRARLQQLIDWRNAIAHQDFSPLGLGDAPVLHLARVRSWRRSLNALSRHFDQVVYNYLRTLLGHNPW